MSAVVSKKSILCAPVAQLDRASDYGSEGWGFEFLQAHGRKSPADYWQDIRTPTVKGRGLCV
jgi:hypothetical protein